MKRSSFWRRLLLSLATIVAVGLAVSWFASRPPQPDAFYDPPNGPLPAPGTLLRREPLAEGTPLGSRGWRILYVTTRPDGRRVAASGVVLAPIETAAGPRPILAWTHGTTGVVSGCAPSLDRDNPFPNIPALKDIPARGWLLVAPDYPGLGTAGGHAYLIGEDAARATLDAIRAARSLTDLNPGTVTVVWGHSQGGAAALWTGQAAPVYAPDIPLAGVAAMAPASDLPALIAASGASPFGKLVSTYLTVAYAEAYDDVKSADYIGPAARPLVRDIASRCVSLLSAAESYILPGRIFRRDPSQGPLGARIAANVPVGPISAPVLIAQGRDDDLVLPSIQARYAAARCAAGQVVDYRTYPGDHLSLLKPESGLPAELLEWTNDRIAGQSPTAECRLADQAA